MTTWGLANWENSQTTWDYRHNRDLKDPQQHSVYSNPNLQCMAKRFQSPRKAAMEPSTTQSSDKLYSTGTPGPNKIIINPNNNGYVTATIRRNNISMGNKKKQLG